MSDHVHLDTNVVILAMGGDRQLTSFIHGRHPVISVVVEMELLCYPLAKDDERARIAEFLKEVRVQMLDDRVKLEAIRIRRTHGLKLLDAIVAATAHVDQCALLTGDKQFKRLQGEQGIIYYERT